MGIGYTLMHRNAYKIVYAYTVVCGSASGASMTGYNHPELRLGRAGMICRTSQSCIQTRIFRFSYV